MIFVPDFRCLPRFLFDVGFAASPGPRLTSPAAFCRPATRQLADRAVRDFRRSHRRPIAPCVRRRRGRSDRPRCRQVFLLSKHDATDGMTDEAPHHADTPGSLNERWTIGSLLSLSLSLISDGAILSRLASRAVSFHHHGVTTSPPLRTEKTVLVERISGGTSATRKNPLETTSSS